MSPLMLILTCVSIIASALVAGVFLSFSDFVMRSLHKADRAGGIQSMQIINREVFRTLFMALLIGMSILSLGLIWLAVSIPLPVVSNLIIAGAVIYLTLVFAVTLFGNVPLNTQLERMAHQSASTADYWAGVFYPRWTFFNHVRTAGSALASICFLLASVWPSINS